MFSCWYDCEVSNEFSILYIYSFQLEFIIMWPNKSLNFTNLPKQICITFYTFYYSISAIEKKKKEFRSHDKFWPKDFAYILANVGDGRPDTWTEWVSAILLCVTNMENPKRPFVFYSMPWYMIYDYRITGMIYD